MWKAGDREKIEKVLGYHFRQEALLRQAFTARSLCNENGRHGESNQVLELCGDSVLSTAILSLLMEKYARMEDGGLVTDWEEGVLSTIKSNLVNHVMLGRRMEEMGLGPLMLLGRGDEKNRIYEQESVREDLFESIIGALYFDCGRDMETVIAVVRRLLDTDAYLAAHTARPAVSSKNAVQEWCAAHGNAPFLYKLEGERGPDNHKVYTVSCTVTRPDGRTVRAVREGGSRKKAELAAAAAVMKELA